MGVPPPQLLYEEDSSRISTEFPDHFRLHQGDQPVSRKIPPVGGCNIQDRVAEHGEKIFNPNRGSKTHVYMCGLRGMGARHRRKP